MDSITILHKTSRKKVAFHDWAACDFFAHHTNMVKNLV